MYLPQPVRDVISRLQDCGFSAYAVGGCVRDSLMGRTPGDYDVTTSARPDDMLRCFADWRVVETGLQHGTVTVVRGGMNVETTAYRIDGVYADHRHPTGVTFTDSLAEDLSRRDFTVNAMAYSDRDGIVDRFGGQRDLCDRIIRCVGEPEKRFHEDGLRILRAMRFAAVLDFTVDPDTARAALDLAPLLSYISRERIHVELKKLVCGVAAPRILRQFAGIAAILFTDVSEKEICAGADAIERLATLSPALPDAISPLCADPGLRFAALFCAFPEPRFRDAIRSLKMARAEENAIRMCRDPLPDGLPERGIPERGIPERALYRRLLGKYGMDGAARRILCERAAGAADEPETRRRLASLTAVEREHLPNTLHDLAVTGSDLQAQGITGAQLGKTLARLLDAVTADALPNERDVLLAAAARIALPGGGL